MEAKASLDALKEEYKYSEATPMMQQYLDIKFQHIDCLLLFRMGDFYELFFEDALRASKLLGIALAKRGKHAGSDLAMCGVPHHSIEMYLLKLLDAGEKVAICEQQETPEEAKKRGYKAVVRREVVRIITPGTILEDSITDTRKPNYLAAIAIDNLFNVSISFVDLATSYIANICCPLAELSSQLINLDPREILLSDRWQYHDDINNALLGYKDRVLYQVDSQFALRKNNATLQSFYKLHSLDSIGHLNDLSIISLGVVLQYLLTTQKQNLPSLPLPYLLKNDDYLFIDAATRCHLELTSSVSRQYKGSLLSVINRCQSKQGSRLLYQFLSNPLNDLEKINARLQLTQWMYEHEDVMQWLRSQLVQIGDIERSIFKIAMHRAFARDLLDIAATIAIASEIKTALHKFAENNTDQCLLKQIYNSMDSFEDIGELITKVISVDAPNQFAQGGVILPSYHPKLEQLSKLINNTEVIIAELQGYYRSITGVENLKITRNNVLGYFVEVTAKHAAKVTHEDFTHRQSTQNAVRFSTEKLQGLENEIMTAKAQMQGLEEQIWQDVCLQVMEHQQGLNKLSNALSLLDVFSNFAYIAGENKYHMPQMVDDGVTLDIRGGRHPVVEQYLQKQHEDFVENDCSLHKDEKIWLLTGPNMAGKSTFLRQNALMIIMAQIGSFVPAISAKIAVTDKLFSRIGASDDLAQGQSTFMVEMIETSAILNQATDRSFIILDEVGRGTSTYDGMSIAWAILEYIHNDLGARSLFATHYHELTQLSNSLSKLANYSSKIDDTGSKLLFLHKVVAGSADKSYGLHVAELAGLPKAVLFRAQEILSELETTHDHTSGNKQLSLGISAAAKPLPPEEDTYNEQKSKELTMIESVNPDELSPKQALEFLYKLKQQ